MSRQWHFGDPCIHCGVAHDDIQPGPCNGDRSKARPFRYRSLGVRWDGVEHFLIRFTDGSVREQHQHVSFHGPYYHFGFREFGEPLPQDLTLTRRP